MYAQEAIKPNTLLRNGAYGIVMRGVQKCTCAGASLRDKNSAPLCCINLDTATDPCCGSGGMFVQSEKFIEAHADRYNGKAKEIDKLFESVVSVYGQESNQTTWRLCKMNLALRGIDSSNVKWNNEGSFLNDAHPDLRADFVIANPPFNDSDWSGELLRTDGRWQYSRETPPPPNNANYAWIQHFLYHLNPKGTAGFVLAKGSLSSKTNGEDKIRKALIEAGLGYCQIVFATSDSGSHVMLPGC